MTLIEYQFENVGIHTIESGWSTHLKGFALNGRVRLFGLPLHFFSGI